MGYYWIRITVFNYHECLGSFYTNAETKQEWVKEINEKYGLNCWTRYDTLY